MTWVWSLALTQQAPGKVDWCCYSWSTTSLYPAEPPSLTLKNLAARQADDPVLTPESLTHTIPKWVAKSHIPLLGLNVLR